MEAERKQQEELERQLQKQRELELEKEEQRKRELEAKEAARKYDQNLIILSIIDVLNCFINSTENWKNNVYLNGNRLE